MKALVYLGPCQKALEERRKPALLATTDAIVRMTRTTLSGIDLRIVQGDLPSCRPGRVLGREGVGVVDEAGSALTAFQPGDPVLIRAVSACGQCAACHAGQPARCSDGGWLLGHRIDGTQAQYVRIPHADTSLVRVPDDADDASLAMLSDLVPHEAPRSSTPPCAPTLTHWFRFDRIVAAYDFARVAAAHRPRVVVETPAPSRLS